MGLKLNNMLYEKFLVEKLFTPEQIENLREVYCDGAYDYFTWLKRDPFAHDYTQENLQDSIKDILPDVAFEDAELLDLVRTVYQYFI